jgi:hypothetical protein
MAREDAETMNALAIFLLATLTPVDASAPTAALDPRVGHRYEVTQRSQIGEGCFGLCACPIVLHGGLEGGFVLHPRGAEGSFQVFDVRQVKWVYPAMFGNSTTFVTGAGTWRVDSAARLQQLDLELVLSGQAPAPYGSGLVPLTVDFPAISVAIQRVGEFCFETRFDLVAQPRPRAPAPGLPAEFPGAQSGGAPAPPTSWGTLKSSYDPPR